MQQNHSRHDSASSEYEHNESEMEYYGFDNKKRTLSETGSDTDGIASKKGKATNSPELYNELIDVFIESNTVALSKANPIVIARALNDHVGSVTKIIPLRQGGLKITCTGSQARILKGLKNLDKYPVKVNVKQLVNPRKKGIIHGVSLEIEIEDIEIADFSIEKAERLMKYDQNSKTRVHTESVIITFKDSYQMPDRVYLGYWAFKIKEFIPHPIRCYHCQSYGHTATVCRNKQRCVRCGENHQFSECPNPEKPKCCLCGENHSAAYKGCVQFENAKKVQIISTTQKISYAQAVRQVVEPQTKPTISIPIQTKQTKLMVNAETQTETQTDSTSQTDIVLNNPKFVACLHVICSLYRDEKFFNRKKSDKIETVTKIVAEIFELVIDPKEVYKAAKYNGR
jgi:hypothetical protein